MRSTIAATAALLVLTACSANDPAADLTTEPETAPPAPSSTADATTPNAETPMAEAYDEVTFQAIDGEERSGRLFGSDRVAVVLSHMGRGSDGQHDWAGFAQDLADRDYQALTFQRRGARSDFWMDIVGAVDYLRSEGADTVIVGGASLGAMGSLYAAGEAGSEMDGLIWLAGVRSNRNFRFDEADVSKLACPMLFISGDEDGYGAAADTSQIHEWATAPSELVLIESRRHGTDIFEEDAAKAELLTSTMIDFIEQVDADDSTEPC